AGLEPIERARDRDARNDVPARASARQDELQSHCRTSFALGAGSAAIFARSPAAAAQKRSDEPPKLTNGSAIPFGGTEAVATATFMTACRPSARASPVPRKSRKSSRARASARAITRISVA